MLRVSHRIRVCGAFSLRWVGGLHGLRFGNLLLVVRHDVFHDDFFLVEDVITFDVVALRQLAAVQVEIVVEIDSVRRALALVLLQLHGGALPPEVTVWLVRQRDLPHRVGQRVLEAEGVGSEPQVLVVFKRVGDDRRLVLRSRFGDQRDEKHANRS